MRTVELTKATGSLSDYVRKARRVTPVLTRRRKAVAAMVSLDEGDYFSMRLAAHPDFVEIIRAFAGAGTGGRNHPDRGDRARV